jgi:hypothetical protein
MILANCSRLRASMRKSSSSESVWAKSSTIPTGLIRSASLITFSAQRATKRMMRMSAATRSAMPGRCTLTTTFSPPTSVAVCTWAMEAEASGLGSSAVSFTASAPSSAATIFCTSSKANGRTRSRHLVNSSLQCLGKTPVDEAMIWPNLMKVGPKSSEKRRRSRGSCTARRACRERAR